MKIVLRALLVATPLLLAAALHSAAESRPPGSDERGPETVEPRVADPLEELAWLAGHWVGEGLNGWNETLWSPPRSGSMMGVYRHIRDGRVVFYEFITISVRGDTVVKALKHFHPDMTGWEEPTESVRFPLLRADRDEIVFDGLTYRRHGADRMEVTVLLGPAPDHLEPETFSYRRVGSTGP